MSAQKKIILFVTLFITFLFFFIVNNNLIPLALAQGKNSTKEAGSVLVHKDVQLEPLNFANTTIFQQTNINLIAFINTIGCLVEGSSIIGQRCVDFVIPLTQNDQVKPYLIGQNINGGAIGFTQRLMVNMFNNPPIHPSEYLASVGDGLGFVKPAFAQVSGSGGQVLIPIFKLWEAVRNLSYLMMTIIFLIVGFMVMMRRRINPQTIITIQSSIPRLILGLILITFSYFIASVLTDIAFVGSRLVGTFVVDILKVSNSDPSAILNNQSFLTMMSDFVASPDHAIIDAQTQNIVSSFSGLASNLVRIGGILIGCQIGQVASIFNVFQIPIGSIVGCGAGGSLGGSGFLFGWIIYIVLIVVLLFSMFRLLFSLIGNYITILVLTITAPFVFLMGSLPGSGDGVSNWIRSFLCAVLAFPAVFGAFYLAAYFLGPGVVPTWGILPPGPDFVSNNITLPLFGGLSKQLIQMLLAYGILIATPTVPGYICRAITKPSRTEGLIEKDITGAFQGGGRRAGGLAGGLASAGGKIGPAIGKALKL